MNMTLVGVLIPVFNATERLNQVLAETVSTLDADAVVFELLLVDDGSTVPVEQTLDVRLPLKVIRHNENMGKGSALRTGFNHFLQNDHCEAVITLDADMQHPPEFMPKFIKCFHDGAELVLGSRKRDPQVMPFHRIFSNAITSKFISMMIQQPIADSQCGFRLYNRRLIQTVSVKEDRFHFESEFLIKAGWHTDRIAEVPIPTIYNGAPSAIGHVRDTLSFIEVICRLLKDRITGNV